MLHVIVGNGSVKEAELTESIDSCWSAAERSGENYWVCWLVESDTDVTLVDTLAKWAQESGLGIRIVGGEDFDVYPSYEDFFVETDQDPYDFFLTQVYPTLDESAALLALLPDDLTTTSEFTVRAVKDFIDKGLRVQDLSHQMVEIRLESDEPSAPVAPEAESAEAPAPEPQETPAEAETQDGPSEAPEAAESVPAGDPLTDYDSGLTLDDYKSLTLPELRSQCENLGLEVHGDKRAKDPYAEALYQYYRAEKAPVIEEPVEAFDESDPTAPAEELAERVVEQEWTYDNDHSPEPDLGVNPIAGPRPSDAIAPDQTAASYGIFEPVYTGAVVNFYRSDGTVSAYVVDVEAARKLIEQG